MDYKVEGNIIYPDKQMLTWGPFYYHSKDKALERSEEVLKDITEWCNEEDPSLKIEPKNVKRLLDEQIIFDIQAWKDDDHLENCDGIITIEEIYFED
jgi:hypothetical protein